MSKRLYLAGKIRKNDWRHTICPGLREVSQIQGNHVLNAFTDSDMPDWEEYDIPALGGAWTYVGPYFSGCDHGCTHGLRNPGHAITGGCILDATRSKDWAHQTGYRNWVQAQCLEAIRRCDVFFAWIDNTTAYGTLTEIGYAKGIGKKTVVASAQGESYGLEGELDNLWFAFEMADTTIFRNSPKAALQALDHRW